MTEEEQAAWRQQLENKVVAGNYDRLEHRKLATIYALRTENKRLAEIAALLQRRVEDLDWAASHDRL